MQQHPSTSARAFADDIRSVAALFLTAACALGINLAHAADSPSAGAATACDARPLIEYRLGPKSQIDQLYPVIRTASMSAYDSSMAMAANIQLYLQSSLVRDQITDACRLAVTPDRSKGYKVSFRSAHPKAAGYGATQQAWLERGKLALNGIVSCQNSKDKSCWEPTGATADGKPRTCSGPWQFYLPLGLPMVSQRMVMLLHYPPYSAMQQSDYLNNATLHRWQRLLETVGVATSDWPLYTTTVDVMPVAAPGSGETGCFPTTSSTNYFGSRGSGYIPTMLNALIAPPAAAMPTNTTLPVIVFGGEAIGYWNAAYPNTPTGVLKAGSASLDPKQPAKKTPFMGANHPIAAVYQTCKPAPGQPGIVTMVGQDLTTACFAKAMAASPAADPAAIQATCQGNYMSANPAPEFAAQVCVTAAIDLSPQFANWSTAQAKAWCEKNNNKVCP